MIPQTQQEGHDEGNYARQENFEVPFWLLTNVRVQTPNLGGSIVEVSGALIHPRVQG